MLIHRASLDAAAKERLQTRLDKLTTQLVARNEREAYWLEQSFNTDAEPRVVHLADLLAEADNEAALLADSEVMVDLTFDNGILGLEV